MSVTNYYCPLWSSKSIQEPGESKSMHDILTSSTDYTNLLHLNKFNFSY